MSDGELTGMMRTRADNDKRRRKQLRAKLRAEGVNDQLIEKIIQQERYAALVARHGPEEARRIIAAQTHKEPNDVGYVPNVADPLLKGTARVSGIAAKVVRRRNTVTQFQYNELVKK